jgi:hypothetical protein
MANGAPASGRAQRPEQGGTDMARTLSSQPDLVPIDPDPEPDDDALECLAKVTVGSFTATPTTVPPFGGSATLRWGVTVPSGCVVGIKLNGTPVGRSGSQEVHPAITTTYTLVAALRGLTRVLKSVSVRVDTSACVTRSVPESLIRSQVRSAVAELDAAESRLSQRSDPSVEIDADGIHVALRFKLAIDNFADPNIDVDFTIGLRVRNGSVEPFYKSFAVDVDWPWWVTVITAGVSKIVEEFIDGRIEARLKPAILAAVKEQIDDLVDQIPGDLRLHSLSLAENEIRVTVCPSGGDTPFLVLATSPPVGGDTTG